MAELRTYRCDVCPAVMKEGEVGWYRAFSDPDASIFIITGWDTDLTTDEIHFIADQEQKHLCSESCAAKLMSRAIGSGTSSQESTTDESMPPWESRT